MFFSFDFLIFFSLKILLILLDALGFMSFQQHSFGFPFKPFSSTDTRLANSALNNTILRITRFFSTYVEYVEAETVHLHLLALDPFSCLSYTLNSFDFPLIFFSVC